MRVYGIDLTSNPSARTSIAKDAKWMTLARCKLEENQLSVEKLELLNGKKSGDFSNLDTVMSSGSKWIAGIDVPLGLPVQCIEYFDLLRREDEQQDWDTYIERCREIEDRASFKAMIESWRHLTKKNKRGDMQRVRMYRIVDKIAKAHSPMNCIRPPVGQMFYEATKRLYMSPAQIAPVRLSTDKRVVIEAYPRLVADRFIQNGNYKEADGLEHIRQLILDQITSEDSSSIMMQWYGFSVHVSDDISRVCVEDRDGDKLDSILCAIQAAWASRQTNYGMPTFSSKVLQSLISLEGWIADPFIKKFSTPHSTEETSV